MPRPQVTEIPPALEPVGASRGLRCARADSAGAPGERARRGFTLTELIVVAVVVALMISLGLPAFTALNRAGTFSQVQSTITSMSTRAQIRSYEQKAGLLITRARKNEQRKPQPVVNDLDRNNPAQNYQVVRLVTRAPYPDQPDNEIDEYDPNNFDIPLNDIDGKDGSTNWPYYRQVDETEPVVLSETTWVAPDYAIDPRPNNANQPLLELEEFEDDRLVNLKTRFPAGGDDNESESLVNAFFIIFDQGQNVRDAFAPEEDHPRGCDDINEPFLRYTFINSSDDFGSDNFKRVCDRSFWMEFEDVSGSARGAVLYDRRGLVDAGIGDDQALDRWKYLRNEGTPLYSRRYGGEIVQGQKKAYEQ